MHLVHSGQLHFFLGISQTALFSTIPAARVLLDLNIRAPNVGNTPRDPELTEAAHNLDAKSAARKSKQEWIIKPKVLRVLPFYLSCVAFLKIPVTPIFAEQLQLCSVKWVCSHSCCSLCERLRSLSPKFKDSHIFSLMH